MELCEIFSKRNIKPKNEKRIVRFTSITFLIQIFYSFNLWISSRAFPLVPIIQGTELFQCFDYVLLIVFLLSLICNILFPNEYACVLTLFLMLFLILLDINRLQPWTYVYVMIYALASLPTKQQERSLITGGLQILIVGMFFWSGVAKLNPNFLEVTFLTILTKSFKINDVSFFINYKEIGYLLGLLEMFAGLFLVFKRSRKLGVGLVIGCHLFIIYFVSPFSLGRDYIVIPWNMLMIYLVTIVFVKVKKFEVFIWKGKIEKIIKITTITLMLLLPSLNLVGKWDHFLSFNLYSDKMDNLIIVVEEDHIHKLSIDFQKRFVKSKEIEGGRILNLIDWSFDELNTPYYPEDWVLNEICKRFCEFGIPLESLVFLKIKGAVKSENIRKHDCKDI